VRFWKYHLVSEFRMPSPPRRYPADLTYAEWTILEALIPTAEPGGRLATWSRRTLCIANF
jgi:hypothetical protein